MRQANVATFRLKDTRNIKFKLWKFWNCSSLSETSYLWRKKHIQSFTIQMISSAKASFLQNNLAFSIFQIWSWCPYLEYSLFSKMADEPDQRTVESLPFSPFCGRIFNRWVFWLRLKILLAKNQRFLLKFC